MEPKSPPIVVNNAQSQKVSANPKASPNLQYFKDGPDSISSMQQDAFEVLQQNISNGFAEQRLMLKKTVAIQDKILLQQQQLQDPNSTPVPSPSRPISRRYQEPLAHVSYDCTTKNSSLPYPPLTSITSYSLECESEPTRREKGRSDTCSELCNESRSLSLVRSSLPDWFEKCLALLQAIAHGIKHLFWMMLALDSRLLALYTALQTRIPQIPSINLSINDSIRLIDAFGQERRLQYATHQYFSVFKAFLAEDYKNTPSGPYIVQDRYRLLDMNASRLDFLNEISWSRKVSPGCKITLSIVLRGFAAREGDICPSCGHQTDWTWEGDRHICSCGLTYYHSHDPTEDAPKIMNDSEALLPAPTKPRSSPKPGHRQDTNLVDNNEELSEMPIRVKSDASTDPEDHDIRIFKRVIPLTSSKSHGILYCTLITDKYTPGRVQRAIVKLISNSEPFSMMLTEFLVASRSRDYILSLEADAVGSLWIRRLLPYWSISVNETLLQCESTWFGRKSSRGRRLHIGDSIFAMDLRIENAPTYHFRVVGCHFSRESTQYPVVENSPLYDQHAGQRAYDALKYRLEDEWRLKWGGWVESSPVEEDRVLDLAKLYRTGSLISPWPEDDREMEEKTIEVSLRRKTASIGW